MDTDMKRLLEGDGLLKSKRKKRIKQRVKEQPPEAKKKSGFSKFKNFFGKGGVREKIRNRKS